MNYKYDRNIAEESSNPVFALVNLPYRRRKRFFGGNECFRRRRVYQFSTFSSGVFGAHIGIDSTTNGVGAIGCHRLRHYLLLSHVAGEMVVFNHVQLVPRPLQWIGPKLLLTKVVRFENCLFCNPEQSGFVTGLLLGYVERRMARGTSDESIKE